MTYPMKKNSTMQSIPLDRWRKALMNNELYERIVYLQVIGEVINAPPTKTLLLHVAKETAPSFLKKHWDFFGRFPGFFLIRHFYIKRAERVALVIFEVMKDSIEQRYAP